MDFNALYIYGTNDTRWGFQLLGQAGAPREDVFNKWGFWWPLFLSEEEANAVDPDNESIAFTYREYVYSDYAETIGLGTAGESVPFYMPAYAFAEPNSELFNYMLDNVPPIPGGYAGHTPIGAANYDPRNAVPGQNYKWLPQMTNEYDMGWPDGFGFINTGRSNVVNRADWILEFGGGDPNAEPPQWAQDLPPDDPLHVPAGVGLGALAQEQPPGVRKGKTFKLQMDEPVPSFVAPIIDGHMLGFGIGAPPLGLNPFRTIREARWFFALQAIWMGHIRPGGTFDEQIARRPRWNQRHCRINPSVGDSRVGCWVGPLPDEGNFTRPILRIRDPNGVIISSEDMFPEGIGPNHELRLNFPEYLGMNASSVEEVEANIDRQLSPPRFARYWAEDIEDAHQQAVERERIVSSLNSVVIPNYVIGEGYTREGFDPRVWPGGKAYGSWSTYQQWVLTMADSAWDGPRPPNIPDIDYDTVIKWESPYSGSKSRLPTTEEVEAEKNELVYAGVNSADAELQAHSWRFFPKKPQCFRLRGATLGPESGEIMLDQSLNAIKTAEFTAAWWTVPPGYGIDFKKGHGNWVWDPNLPFPGICRMGVDPICNAGWKPGFGMGPWQPWEEAGEAAPTGWPVTPLRGNFDNVKFTKGQPQYIWAPGRNWAFEFNVPFDELGMMVGENVTQTVLLGEGETNPGLDFPSRLGQI
mgnify:FL=1